MERSIELLAAIMFLVIGLSHILQPRLWAEFFIALRAQGRIASIVDGFLYLPLGALIVSFHNVWTGLPMVLTICGWGLILKSVLRFWFPEVGLWALRRVSLARAWEFAAAGPAAVVLAGLFAYMALAR